ncbi:MAG: PIN domain-containing protein [Bacteroidetes bacterium]|jgi:predicted nucleic acid-binding protein|nr:PIN domain-containing protein [Bacteroidota bacterium]
MSAPDRPTCFVDSNIWLYAFIDGQDVQKSEAGRVLLRQEQPAVSTQVINEVSINLLRTGRFSEREIRDLITSFYRRYSVVQLSRPILTRASRLRENHAFSFWDSVIVSSALHSGVATLYSEDMQGGFVVEERMEIVNPFS